MNDAITEGQKAPDFTLSRDGGGTISLSDFAGKNVVLFFYPKDNTPGCTKEAIAFSELKGKFAAKNTQILGMSADTTKRHDNFVAKHNLTVPLAADPDLGTLQDYGVWVEKSMYGRTYMGIVRTTVLIDTQGVILKIWDKVKVKDHVNAVLTAVSAL